MAEPSAGVGPVDGVGMPPAAPKKPVVGLMDKFKVTSILTEDVRSAVQQGKPHIGSMNVVKSVWEQGSALERQDLSSLLAAERTILSAYLALKKRRYKILKKTQVEGFFARLGRSFYKIRKKAAWKDVEKFFELEGASKDKGFKAQAALKKKLLRLKAEDRSGQAALYEKGAALLEKAIRSGVFSSKEDIASHIEEAVRLRKTGELVLSQFDDKPEAKPIFQPSAMQRFFSLLTKSLGEWWIKRKALKACGEILRREEGLGEVKRQIISSLPLERSVAQAYFAELRERLTSCENVPESFKNFLDSLDRISQIAEELSFDPTKGIDPQWYKLAEEALTLMYNIEEPEKHFASDKFKPLFQRFLISLLSCPLVETELELPSGYKQETVSENVTLSLVSKESKEVKQEDINLWAGKGSCGSQNIRQTFGRLSNDSVTVNGETLGIDPCGGNTSKELARVYLLSKKLVDLYLQKNPQAERQAVQNMVDELLLRETIEFSTIFKLSGVSSLCGLTASASPGSTYEFQIEEGKIRCSKNDVITFKDPQIFSVLQKNIKLTLEVSPGDPLPKTRCERMEINPSTTK